MAVIVAVRIAAPYVILGALNRQLSQPGTYQGHIGSLSLALWRGHYELHDLRLSVGRPEKQTREPVLDVDSLSIDINWGKLLRGSAVVNLTFIRPHLYLIPEPGKRTPELPGNPTENPTDPSQKMAQGTDAAAPTPQRWQDKISSLAAFHIDEISLDHGLVEYADLHRGFTVRIGEMHGTIFGLTTGGEEPGRKSSFRFSGTTIGSGKLLVEGHLDPLATTPQFSLRASLEGLNLPDLNVASQHFDHLTFARGEFFGFLEVTAARGHVNGYFKPLFRNLDIASYRDEKGSAAVKIFWKAVVPIGEFILENDDQNQHGARIPIEGRIDDPKTDIWEVIVSALRNAFVKALVPGFRND